MKNKLLLTVVFTCISFYAFSQTADPVTFKNHFGIVASPSLQYFFQNKALPVGLIYKRQASNANQAWRFNISGSYQRQSQPDLKLWPKPVSQNNSSLYLKTMIGYEWQNPLNKNFVFYYGADAGISVNKDVQNSEDYSNFRDDQGNQKFGQTTNYSNSRLLAYILKQMVGFQFRISPKLYLAAESSLILSHSSSSAYSFGSFIPDSEADQMIVITGSHKSNNSRAWYQPLSNIQLVYKF